MATMTRELLKIKVERLHNHMSYIQKEMRLRLAVKHGKIDVLKNYWSKIYAQIQRECQHCDADECTQAAAFCKKIVLVPKHVQNYILKAYVERCRELHCIAFM